MFTGGDSLYTRMTTANLFREAQDEELDHKVKKGRICACSPVGLSDISYECPTKMLACRTKYPTENIKK